MNRATCISVILSGLICWNSGLNGQILNPDKGFVFDDTSVPRIDITISEADLTSLYDNPYSDTEYPVHFRISRDGTEEEVQNVGLRFRGNTSRGKQKKSFKVSFNAFVTGGNFHGLEKLNLNAETNDPSMMRSKLSWELFRYMGTPASRVNHVLLYINDNYYGVYINTEHIDERFVKSRFGNNVGNLYKCLWPADLTYLGSDDEDYKFYHNERRAYDLHTNREWEDYHDLASLIQAINQTDPVNFPAEIEPIFNVQQYLKVMAVDIMTGNWDGYIGNKNNFYLYRDAETGRFEYIAYDLDNTFGIDWLGLDWTDRSIYNWDRDERPLYEKILEAEVYRAQFTNYIRKLASYMFSEEFGFIMENTMSLISEWVSQDPYFSLDWGYTFNDFSTSLTDAFGGHVKYSILDYISGRVSSALQECMNVDSPPLISYARIQPVRDSIFVTWVTEDDDVGFTTALNYRYENSGWESKLYPEPFDTTSVPGFALYRDTIICGTGTCSVNLFLEATDAGGQKVRYPSSFYTISFPLYSGPLFINELMASNNSSLSDEYGEYEDWAEIYNAGNSPVWLGDLYLSDKMGDPGKYRFPGQYIYPGEFVTVWLDGQPGQGAWHAPFRLDMDGELLRLSERPSTGYRIIDLVIFGTQLTDVSYGRENDGGEQWTTFLHPTPGYSNQATDTHYELAESEFMVYPNPVTSTQIFFNRIASGIVIDASGRIVKEFRNVCRLDVSGLSYGLYVIRNEEGTAVKVIINR